MRRRLTSYMFDGGDEDGINPYLLTVCGCREKLSQKCDCKCEKVILRIRATPPSVSHVGEEVSYTYRAINVSCKDIPGPIIIVSNIFGNFPILTDTFRHGQMITVTKILTTTQTQINSALISEIAYVARGRLTNQEYLPVERLSPDAKLCIQVLNASFKIEGDVVVRSMIPGVSCLPCDDSPCDSCSNYVAVSNCGPCSGGNSWNNASSQCSACSGDNRNRDRLCIDNGCGETGQSESGCDLATILLNLSFENIGLRRIEKMSINFDNIFPGQNCKVRLLRNPSNLFNLSVLSRILTLRNGITINPNTTVTGIQIFGTCCNGRLLNCNLGSCTINYSIKPQGTLIRNGSFTVPVTYTHTPA